MVRFDDIHIADDYSQLVVECHVQDYEVYENMYIKSVYLEYYKNRGTIGVPSDKAIQIYSGSDTSVKSIRGVVNAASLSVEGIGTDTFEKGLFYIYVTCDGTLPPTVAALDCDMDSTLDVGVALDWKYLYGLGMKYVASIADGCNPCKSEDGFEDFILLWNALKLAADTCDWVTLERIWPKIIKTRTAAPGGCGCNA